MNRRAFVLRACTGLLAVRGTARRAAIPSDDAIRAILRRRVDVDRRATGMAIGIFERHHRRVITYGRQDSGDARPIGADTLFEIGSLTKVFTALLLADMVDHKELQFDDPVDLHLPPGLRTPQRSGRPITLVDLATHTSGLPLFPPITGNPLETLRRYTLADLHSWLTDFVLPRDPGTQWEYSNVGYCLLGLALAHRSASSYERLLTRRIVDPLRLSNTTVHLVDRTTAHLAIGHSPTLAPIPALDLGIFAPAGALRSTIADLLRFVSAVLPNPGSPLARPAALLLTIRRPAPAIGGEQALGWQVVTGIEPFVVKDGVTAGQAATIVLDPPRHVGVVVLSNALPVRMKAPPDGGIGAADVARHLARPAFPIG